MGLFLVVLMVLTTTIVLLLNATASQSKAAAQLTERTKARLTASAALDHLYARLQTTENFLSAGDLTDIKTPGTPESAAAWFKLVNGFKIRCVDANGQPDLFSPCYYLTVKKVMTDPTLSNTPTALEAAANVRFDCRGDLALCRTMVIEQRLRAWQFSDFLFYTQFNVVSPSLGTPGLFPQRLAVSGGADPCAIQATERRSTADQCPAVAYTSYDQVTGPVYTADDYVMVCGYPNNIFRDTTGTQVRVFARASDGDAIKSAAIRGDSGCPAATGSYGTALSSVLRLPPGRTTFQQAELKATSLGSALRGANVSLTFTPAGAQVSGAGSTTFVPTTSANGTVITVDGDAELSGVVNGRVTVFVSGDAKIVDDLTYNDGTVSAIADDVLGINAGGDIIITQLAPKAFCAAGTEPVRSVNAQLISFNGTIRTQSVESAQFVPTTGCPPILRFYGSMATRYQGVFGLYDSATGRVVRGYQKRFTHDVRAQSNGALIAPYLVTPVGQQWIRLDVAEVIK